MRRSHGMIVVMRVVFLLLWALVVCGRMWLNDGWNLVSVPVVGRYSLWRMKTGVGIQKGFAHVHAWSIDRHQTIGKGRQFVTMPKEDHGMRHKASNHYQSSISKCIGICKMIYMEETKQQEKDARKERNALRTPQTKIDTKEK